MSTQKVHLGDPTPPTEIKQRQGPGGRMLSYVDARFVMQRLDEAVGPENWQDRYEETANGIRCGIGIRFGEDFVWKWDAAEPSDIEPVKGAHSDAFKRAAVKWGIGRDLYGDHPTKPAERPRTAPLPGQSIATGSTTKQMPDEPPWPADTIDPIAAAETIFAGEIDESKCPDHDKPFKSGAKGWYCATPVEKQGGTVTKWCPRKPSKAWAAAQELVPA